MDVPYHGERMSRRADRMRDSPATGGREVDGSGMPLGHVALRPAARGDLDRISQIEHACFADPWSRRSFEALLEDGRVFFRVAHDMSSVLGYVVAWFVGGEGEIANLAVAPDIRRRHVGASLLDAAVGAAGEHRAAALYLEVREGNTAARALYASRGFQEVGRRRGYYRRPVEDALVLRLTLPVA